MIRMWNDFVIQRFRDEDAKVTCPNITFQVTNNCCLRCSYCYQHDKANEYMSIEIAKQAVDLIFKMWEENKEDAFINKHAKGVVLDFIGGEPFLNVKTIDATCEYFLEQCEKKNPDWLIYTRFSITSNGMLYFEPDVQAYLKKYRGYVSLTITLDGPKELHDACRKDINGVGSFDQVFKAWKHAQQIYDTNTTKITLSPDNLPFLDRIFDFFLENHCVVIDGNPIFEHPWTIDEAKIYYQKLKHLADILLDHPEVTSSFFKTQSFNPLLTVENNNWCGGTGQMLAFDPQGRAYPCLRYMADSLGQNREPIYIGDVHGIYMTEEKQLLYKSLLSITRRSQSTDECWNCEIAGGCAWCSAWNYETFGTPDKRSTNICWMHRAAALANVYYWNNALLKKTKPFLAPMYLNRSIAEQIITSDEYDELLLLARSAQESLQQGGIINGLRCGESNSCY